MELTQSPRRIGRIEAIREVLRKSIAVHGFADKDILIANLMSIWGMSRRTIIEYINLIIIQEGWAEIEGIILFKGNTKPKEDAQKSLRSA